MCRAGMPTTPSLLVRSRLVAALVVALVLGLAVAAGADAAVVTSRDTQGRTITFDVRAATVDTEWYAAVLRASAHGNEISEVTIRIVPEQNIAGLCGIEAVACYTRRSRAPTIIVPAGQSTSLAATLLHEYGHHLDTAWSVPGVPELNGTPVWWQARGMASLLSSRRVAFDYSLGWSHSIAEIFAEDYSYIHVGAGYGIPWLSRPDETLKSAMFAELGGAPTTALPPTRNDPLVITRRGTLAPRARRVLPFGLLGPGRHVTLTATVARANRAGVRARAQIVCNGTTVVSQTFARGRAQRTLDVPSLGPAECEARLVSTSRVSLGYTLRLRLAVEGENGGS
jgi:predicted thioesterase